MSPMRVPCQCCPPAMLIPLIASASNPHPGFVPNPMQGGAPGPTGSANPYQGQPPYQDQGNQPGGPPNPANQQPPNLVPGHYYMQQWPHTRGSVMPHMTLPCHCCLSVMLIPLTASASKSTPRCPPADQCTATKQQWPHTRET